MKGKNRTSKKKREAAKKKLILGGAAIGGVLAIVLIAYFALSSVVNKVPENVICDNIYIEDVNVSGMTAKEAKAALEKKQAEYQEKKISLVAEEVIIEVSPGDLGFSIEKKDDLVKSAVAYGKEGGVWKRYSAMKNLEDEKKVFTVTYAVDADTVEKVIEEKIPQLEKVFLG